MLAPVQRGLTAVFVLRMAAANALRASPVCMKASTKPAPLAAPLHRQFPSGRPRVGSCLALNPAIDAFSGRLLSVVPFVRPDCPPKPEEERASFGAAGQDGEQYTARPRFRSALEQARLLSA